MKIALLGPAYPHRGGIAQFIAILAQELQKAGHTVKIFSFINQYPSILFPGKDQFDTGGLQIPIEIEPVLTPYNPLTWGTAICKINDWNPDLLILKYWIPFFAVAFGYVIRRLKKRCNLKVVYIIDNIEFHEKWMFAESLTKYALSKADYYITMSNAVYQTALKLLKRENTTYLLHHPNYDFYTQRIFTRAEALQRLTIEDKPTFLFFGYIKKYKGLDILLYAAKKIFKAIPDSQLLIAGEVYGEDLTYIDIINKENIANSVVFHNRFISNEDVAAYFSVADVTVLPYRSATQSGITQLAFSFDCPVIATDVGGLKEVIRDGENGYIVPAEDSEALANAVIKFYSEHKEEAFSKVIGKEKEKYSWKPMIEVIGKMH